MSTKTEKAKKSPSSSSVKPSPLPSSSKTSSPKAIPPKGSPNKVIPAKSPSASPSKPSPQDSPSITVLKSAHCSTLKQTSLLTYESGRDAQGKLHFRITANNGGGFFSNEWVSWEVLHTACHKTSPVTSRDLRPLLKGKSVNTAGFLLAALLKEGLLRICPGKTRHYQLTETAKTLQ